MRKINEVSQEAIIEALEVGKRCYCNDCQEFVGLGYSRKIDSDVCEDCGSDDLSHDIHEYLTETFFCEYCEVVENVSLIVDHGNGKYHCEACRCSKC